MSRYPPHIQSTPHFSHMWSNIYDSDGSEVILAVGRTGTGKSCLDLFICDSMDVRQTIKNPYGWEPRFSLDRCHFFAKDFIEDITKQDENKKSWYPKGTCFMFDEANVENTNTEWYDMKSKAVATALQTNRKFNYIICMTSPDFNSLAIGTRRRVTVIISMTGHKRKINGWPHAQCKIEWLDYDHKTGKPYFKFHRYWKPIGMETDENGEQRVLWRRKRITKVWVPLVRKSLEAPYNKKKDAALQTWYQKIGDDLEYMKKYMGNSNKKQYNSVDLMNVFKKEGKTDFTGILGENNKVFDFLVEEKLMASGYEGVSVRDFEKLLRWLRYEQNKATHTRNIDLSGDHKKTDLRHSIHNDKLVKD